MKAEKTRKNYKVNETMHESIMKYHAKVTKGNLEVSLKEKVEKINL
jgi:hypothetical protein